MTDEKYCPLTNAHCKCSSCMFWAIKKKSHVNKEGEIIFVDAGGYCLVRDFLLTVINRE